MIFGYLEFVGSCQGVLWTCWSIGRVSLGGIGILRFGALCRIA
jgi:hypothetical protein